MHRSFELYRRNLYEPEVITFDELLARAEWHVEVAEREDSQQSEEIPRGDGLEATAVPWNDDDIPF